MKASLETAQPTSQRVWWKIFNGLLTITTLGLLILLLISKMDFETRHEDAVGQLSWLSQMLHRIFKFAENFSSDFWGWTALFLGFLTFFRPLELLVSMGARERREVARGSAILFLGWMSWMVWGGIEAEDPDQALSYLHHKDGSWTQLYEGVLWFFKFIRSHRWVQVSALISYCSLALWLFLQMSQYLTLRRWFLEMIGDFKALSFPNPRVIAAYTLVIGIVACLLSGIIGCIDWSAIKLVHCCFVWIGTHE